MFLDLVAYIYGAVFECTEMNVSNWFCCYQGKESKTLFSSGQKIKRFGELWVPGMHLSKGCRCEVVFCLWFCCYFLLAAGQVTDPTEGIYIPPPL